jgi:elongation factor P
MILSTQLRAGMAVRFEGQPYKVLWAEYHPGQGKMSGATHSRLLNLNTGTTWEHSFRADLKLEDLALEKRPMEFLYSDDDSCCFMDPVTADQVDIPNAMLGNAFRLLAPAMRISIEFLAERPVSVQMPDFLELSVADTAPSAHSSGQDNTWKPAKLENELEILVPQFVKIGDVIRVDTHSLKYMDRLKGGMK